MKFIVTGGGTGGHIYPALAVADALRRVDPEAQIQYIGGTSGMETQIVPPTGIQFHGVTTKKLRKVASPSTIGVLLALLKGYRESAAFMRQFDPDVVISTGGYVAAATAIAAARQGRPTIIQAQDAVPGRTNLWLSRWATRICIWFEESAKPFPAAKVVRTGLPIRREIVSSQSPCLARRALGLAEDAFTVLVVGGSQGARRLNEIVVEAAGILPPAVQILHQTGANNFDAVFEAAKAKRLADTSYFPRAYFDSEQIPLAYRAADLVVCRCGVGTLAESMANGLPALMVPLPTAYADHQTANARAVERVGGGILLPQDTLTPEELAAHIESLRQDDARRETMAASSRALGRPAAADHVAELALELARK